MKFEATQKGNPYKLTTDQHVFPKACIDRFSNTEGFVEVFSYNAKKVLKIKSNNSLFCAKRVWDQRTEVGIGKRIEDRFQNLVRGIQSGSVTVIGYFEKIVVEDFFSLWRSRQKFKLDGLPDVQVDRISSDPLTKDQQEILESNHTIFFRDGVMPGRFAAGIHVVGYINAFRHDNRNTEWGIVRAVDGEFIVPDCFEDMMIIPISPKLSIIADQPNSTLTRCEVAVNNQVAINRSTNYYFARDLSKCPVYREYPPRLQRILAL
ncbi:hypothetical protein J3D54_005573 [Pseudomonas sp. GGS8]|uniref:hypothetical protein n=1 Tax=Pseudomonas sp. GGS8 TaxID=2817892 RepID=UPI00209E138B|nr:hypothetical protein [Pseudomonas sp. GGS8]MCP1446441.1 hypothetical protein [Pseudomonas sp. GGS8]